MPRRLRPTRLEHVVDGHALRARLSAAALDSIGNESEQRARAIEILKQALFRGRMIAKERLENGASGVETSRLLSGVTDEVITALEHRPGWVRHDQGWSVSRVRGDSWSAP